MVCGFLEGWRSRGWGVERKMGGDDIFVGFGGWRGGMVVVVEFCDLHVEYVEPQDRVGAELCRYIAEVLSERFGMRKLLHVFHN